MVVCQVLGGFSADDDAVLRFAGFMYDRLPDLAVELIASLARPGGSITGLTLEVDAA